MEATVQLTEALADRLVRLAMEEGTTLDGLVQRLVSEHLERRKSLPGRRSVPPKDVRFPLIPGEETGTISPITGADLDDMFASDDFTS
jgi:hypothetical protein